MEEIQRRNIERTQLGILIPMPEYLDSKSQDSVTAPELDTLHSHGSELMPQSSNVYKKHWDPHTTGPRGSCGRKWYELDPWVVPVMADKPHMMIMMFDPFVAPEGDLLWSEYDAIISMFKSRSNMEEFTNRHTRPALVVAFQHETHARITQARIDAKTNKTVIRQLRQFNVYGTPGKLPADAYLLLRWVLNTPIGATKYKNEEFSSEGVTKNTTETGGAEMLVVPKIVVVKSGQ
ncbi:hypothetical protein N0V88_007985 [Collariella sp. IMI 366227]|nr:hypothetical protein N0V88_007985 [Collariella sp. IMI 366227]